MAYLTSRQFMEGASYHGLVLHQFQEGEEKKDVWLVLIATPFGSLVWPLLVLQKDFEPSNLSSYFNNAYKAVSFPLSAETHYFHGGTKWWISHFMISSLFKNQNICLIFDYHKIVYQVLWKNELVFSIF